MNPNDVIFSTNYDKAFSVNKIQRSYELEYEDGSLEGRIDFNDWNIQRILRQITQDTPERYNGYKKFTTLCNTKYGNTTIWRLVLVYNGFMHPYEIPGGAIIRFPDPTELRNAVLNVSQIKRTARSVIF